MEWYEILGRLVLAVFCSALIGFERESARKEAGFRTHMLVGTGSAMFTIVSITGFEGGDESRLAAQIVTGIGFLGAGAIFKEGATVKGLTTAAGLWAVAAVGVAAGTGSVFLAVLGTALVGTIFIAFHRIDAMVARRKHVVPDRLEVVLDETKRLESILDFTRRIDPSAEQLSFRRTSDRTGVLIVAVDERRSAMLREMLSSLKGVKLAGRLSPLYWHDPKDT